MMLGKLQRAHPTLHGHFAPAYLVESNMLRAYLFFIYGAHLVNNDKNVYKIIYNLMKVTESPRVLLTSMT